MGSNSGIVGTDSGKSAKVPTINRNGCPRSIGVTAHDQTEWVPTMPRNTQELANTRRSHHRARVEHAFGAMVQQGGKFLRTIGMARAEVKIGMMNLVYNMRRFTCLMQQSVAR